MMDSLQEAPENTQNADMPCCDANPGKLPLVTSTFLGNPPDCSQREMAMMKFNP